MGPSQRQAQQVRRHPEQRQGREHGGAQASLGVAERQARRGLDADPAQGQRGRRRAQMGQERAALGDLVGPRRLVVVERPGQQVPQEELDQPGLDHQAGDREQIGQAG